MNKTEMIESISQKTGLNKKEAAAAMNAIIDTIKEAMASGDKIALPGFATFEVKERPARTSRNPRTGETIEVPAAKVPKARFGKAMKELVNP